MIPRYTRPEMARIFSPEARLELWLKVELAAAEAMAALGHVPADAIARLKARVETDRARLIDPARVEAIETTTRHDVIAFLTHVEEVCGPDARFLHLGLTSSDLLDTTLALQLRAAADLLLDDLDRVVDVLETRAFEHKLTPTIGRSHGIQAEPTTFGLKLASFHAEFRRHQERLIRAREEIGTCALSGAVGTFANVDPAVEVRVAQDLGLRPEPISTQIIPRDRHAAFTAALALLASGVERVATEIRHLQRSEVREAEERFHAGQKGSSAMPHKRNPVLSENLTGLARMIRAAVIPALENVALWHERDISHSSVERVMLPDACILADFALHRLAGLIEDLSVHPERMLANLEASLGLYNSQRVLLALTQAGLPRGEAYAIVQRSAMQAWEKGRPLRDLLAADPEVAQHLDEKALAALFDLQHHFRHVDVIFERVFGHSRGVPATAEHCGGCNRK
jgi:adenylosuccinate lyase